jgi:Dynamin family
MKMRQFEQQLQAYVQHREHLIASVTRYQAWLDRYELNSVSMNESIHAMIETLRSDRITLAFAAEFSRGKTELINAMFFAETGVRLLPSTPGRTTMCPTELLYDPDGGNYIRLLAIESRLDKLSLSEYKQRSESWMQIDLDCSSPAQMQEAFKELIAVKRVSLDQAKKLGLYHEDLHHGQAPADSVEIPCWRHAIISFPHHLLKEGLVILDTPGLNALGSEPELTLNMLPNAQAVLFVLAADTGVTKSDLDMWRNHVRGARAKRKSGLIVVMNKVDTLWDDLGSEADIDAAIRLQVDTTASILNIDESVIFPVSAKQGLLAKVKSDQQLLAKSRLMGLEEYLSTVVLDERQRLLVASVTEGIGHLVDASWTILASEVGDIGKQLEDLRHLGGENQSATVKLMSETREEQNRYLASVDKFQASRRVFSSQTSRLLEALSPQRTDEIIQRTKKQMIGSLTTVGMKRVMRSVFDELRDVLQDVVKSTEETRRLVKTIYKIFQSGHGFKEIRPQLFSIRKYQLELELLFEEGEAFRDSASSTLMQQNLVVQKIYDSIIGRAREVMEMAHKDAGMWRAMALSPLLRQIKDHKKMIENRLESLRTVNMSKEHLDAQVQELEQTIAPLRTQYDELEAIRKAMQMDDTASNDMMTDMANEERDIGLEPLAAMNG